MLTARARAIHDLVTWVAGQLRMDDIWQYELAANLCLIGCLNRAGAGISHGLLRPESLSAEEQRMYRAHPETGRASLLSKIPRLEAIAGMIRWQQNPWAGDAVVGISTQGLHPAPLGARVRPQNLPWRWQRRGLCRDPPVCEIRTIDATGVGGLLSPPCDRISNLAACVPAISASA